MEFLFLKILLVFLGISYSLPFLNAKVVMEPSSDGFPTIEDLKSSISFNQTFIPFDMSDCYFETIENIDVICDTSDWSDEDMDQIELPGKIRYLSIRNSQVPLQESLFENRTVYLLEIINNTNFTDITEFDFSEISHDLQALSVSKTGLMVDKNVSFFNSFQELHQLKYLILEDNPNLQFEDVGVEEDDDFSLPNLEYLSLKGSDLRTLENQVFKPLNYSSSLKLLNLQSCNISTIQFATFLYLPHLEHIGKLKA